MKPECSNHKLIILDCEIEDSYFVSESTSCILDLNDPSSEKTSKELTLLSQSEKDKIRYHSLRDIMAFGDTIIKNKSVADHLNIENASVFFYHRFRVLTLLTNLEIKYHEVVNQLKYFEKIRLHTNSSQLKNYFSSHNDIEVIIHENKKQSINYKALFSVLISYSLRTIKGFFNISTIKNKYKVAFVDAPATYIKDGDNYKNPFLNSLHQLVGNKVLLISELPVFGVKGKSVFTKRDNHSVHNHKKNVLWGEYLILKTLITHYKEWQKRISLIKAALKGLKKHEWTPKHEFILNNYVKLQSTTNYYILKELAYQNFFKNSSIKSLLASDENSIAQRVILNAAKLNNIKTYGVQHGAIGNASANYMYSKNDMLLNPIPDITFLWGNYWKNILITEGNFPAERLMVVGQLRTDDINYKKRKPTDYKHIVFASQPMPDEGLRHKALLDVYKLANSMPSHKFTIRNHPREYDLTYFTTKMNGFNLQNLSIDGKSDLYKQLSNTDILITCYSTVAIEALYFNIPVILIDYGKTDVLNFKGKGIADICYSYEDLETAVNKKASENQYFNKNALHYKKELSYKIDGKVAERILKEIGPL